MEKQFREHADFIGTHFIYTCANGWEYEWCCYNENTVDCRIPCRWGKAPCGDVVSMDLWYHEKNGVRGKGGPFPGCRTDIMNQEGKRLSWEP